MHRGGRHRRGGATLFRQGDGKILLGGWFNEFTGVPRNHLVRLHPDGAVDMSFDPGQGVTDYIGTGQDVYPRVRFFLPVANQRLLVGGVFTKYDGQLRNSLARVAFSAPVGIQETATPWVPGVHPNPFHDAVRIALPADAGALPFVVLDARGAQVATGTVHATSPPIDLGHLPSGMYQLRAGNSGSARVIKQ